MRKQQTLLSGLLMLMGVSMANAQKVYTSVQQNDVKIDNMGTAAFDLSKSPSVGFVDGKAVMTVNGNKVAVLPMSDNGQLAVELSGTESNVSMTLNNGYGTVYSPFQLQLPASSDVEVYAPTYENGSLKLNDDTKVASGAIVPAGTGLVLKSSSAKQGSSSIDFTFSDEAATDTHVSALSGSAQAIEQPSEEEVEGKTVYVFGYDSTTNEYGFIPYDGEDLAPGSVYLLVAKSSQSQEEESVPFNTTPTAISNVLAKESPLAGSAFSAGKFVENGRVIIVKNNKKYNLNGQEVK